MFVLVFIYLLKFIPFFSLKAYQTFANRVSHLKRKLDNLKATLPDLDDSPIPSPSADAPSPTGSESPFHGLELANPDPDLDGSAMDDEAEPPAPSPLSSPGGSPKHTEILGNNDNREVEDMDLSEEEMDSGGIIGKAVFILCSWKTGNTFWFCGFISA